MITWACTLQLADTVTIADQADSPIRDSRKGSHVALSKEELIKARFGVEDFELAGVGTVRIKPLTRAQALEVRGKELTVAEVEQCLLSWAMVEPGLTREDVAAWQEVADAGSFEPLVDRIAEISGMKKGASKSGVPDVRNGS